jgi:hypothetical protein
MTMTKKAITINGRNYFNEENFKEMCEALDKGEKIAVYIDCIGHTRNMNEQLAYREALVEKYPNNITIWGDSNNGFEYQLIETFKHKNKQFNDEGVGFVTLDPHEAVALRRADKLSTFDADYYPHTVVDLSGVLKGGDMNKDRGHTVVLQLPHGEEVTISVKPYAGASDESYRAIDIKVHKNAHDVRVQEFGDIVALDWGVDVGKK